MSIKEIKRFTLARRMPLCTADMPFDTNACFNVLLSGMKSSVNTVKEGCPFDTYCITNMAQSPEQIKKTKKSTQVFHFLITKRVDNRLAMHKKRGGDGWEGGYVPLIPH